MKRLGLLAGSSVLLWALLAYPAWRFGGESALVHSAVALGLCLLPALATMAWTLGSRSSEQQLAAVLGGSGIRLAVILGGGMLLYESWPLTFDKTFWIWVGVFYLFTQVVEVGMVLRRFGASSEPSDQGRAGS